MLETVDVPEKLYYTETHEWCREENGVITVGITHHAQSLLGDLVYVELPDLDRVVRAGEEICVVESVKAASDVYAPLSGKVIAVNQALANSPELVNQHPYTDGWLFQIELSDKASLQALKTAKQYADLVSSSEG